MLTKVAKARHTDDANEIFTMKNIIRFTCPQCGGHQLMLVGQALHRYIIQNIETDQQGNLVIGNKVLKDDLCGEPIGYRCADCRHPDNNTANPTQDFQWKTLEDIQNSGSITWPQDMAPVEHQCMICLPNGQMNPVIVEVPHPGPLSEKGRCLVLKLEQAEQGVLISQADAGIHSFACRNWKQIKRHIISSTN